MVIAHDCDLANDSLEAEPYVEVIIGRTVAAANGNFSWGKAPRTLHYPVQCEGAPATVELVATEKVTLLKSELAWFEPDTRFSVDGQTLAVLRSWLSARYDRAAFADAFVARMRETKADAKLAKALEAHGKNVSFTYFDVDKGQCVERLEGDPYSLKVVLVFNPGDDPDAAADAAEKAAEAVEEALRGRLPEGGTAIRLDACFAISEDDISVSQARVLNHWRLEYMTHRAEGQQLGPKAD
ncbi:MAG TPA: hypothetical protein VFR90_17315 [Methylibium sp.]|uniref:hypothetical protein n=1 Tax=Methylibium sp. TaxID=2067992 RepID=UPI002DB8B32E|nr:hypothetical protein [Methylibium sp.]HEU4460884.1 hypothetical protein [Methylibium sp.]